MCYAVASSVGSEKIEENNCSDETNPNIIMTDSDIESITSLYLDNNNISKITGIEYFTSLTELRLFNNQITDLTPLKDLTSLTELSLDDNQITDLTPLSNLTSLTYLNLNFNRITGLTPLKDLTSLTKLYLDNNQITDLTPLSNLTNLTELNLPDNQISDLAPLENLSNLNNLLIYENQISDLTPLSKLSNLHSLSLGGNPISDITPILLLNIESFNFLEVYSLPAFASSDTTNNKGYILPSLYQFFNATLDVAPVAEWVTIWQNGMRQAKAVGELGIESQNATINEDGKSITIINTDEPAVVNLWMSDPENPEQKLIFAQLTVIYEGSDDPVDPTDDPAVPNTGKNTQESSTAILTATLCILSGIALAAIPMTRLYCKSRK